ncbi:MAG: ABC transporter permease [Thermofilum sp. ex4484_15]|nr:MAG: ABC transporter permease [Thermofilum sp. ex4484_15]
MRLSQAIHKLRYLASLSRIAQSLLAIVMGFLAGGIMLWASGYNPLKSYEIMFIGDPESGVQGAFGGYLALSNTLREAAFLTLTGLAVAVSFLAGMFNIGVEGAMYIGAFAAFLVGYFISLPLNPFTNLFHVCLALLGSIVAGAFWSYIPAVMKVKRGAHEVVTTIMLNYVAILTTKMIVLRAFLPKTGIVPGGILTPPISLSARVAPIPLPSRAELTLGFPLAIVVTLITYFLLKATTLGYEIRAVGLNPRAAEYGGVNVGKALIYSMVLSGAISGIAGACDVLFVEYRFNSLFSPGYGFDGIAVALIGRLDPIGTALAALFIAAIHMGARSLQPALGMPKELAMAIEGLIIIFTALPEALNMLISKFKGVKVRK